MLTILFTLVALAFILVAITKYDIHPFLALFVGAIGFGLLVGMPTSLIIQSIKDGFGGVMGNIGILILLGVTIGVFLEKRWCDGDCAEGAVLDWRKIGDAGHDAEWLYFVYSYLWG
nr:hypothetical protein [Haliscomenobacter sp.]